MSHPYRFVCFCLGLTGCLLSHVAMCADDSKVQPAEFEVEWRKPRPFRGNADWQNVPAFLQEAVIYDQMDEKAPRDRAYEKISLAVKKSGLLVIAVNVLQEARIDGRAGLTSTTQLDLVRQGWERIGNLTWVNRSHGIYQIFRKQVQAGDTLQFHTSNVPPLALGIKPAMVRAILEAKKEAVTAIDLTALEVPEQLPGRSSDSSLVMLNTRDPKRSKYDYQQTIGRELLRQALLLTAREELGAATRDASILEAFPQDDKGAPPLDVAVEMVMDGFVNISIFRQEGNKFVSLWDREVRLSDRVEKLEGWPDELARVAEEFSRTELVTVLKSAGITGKANAFQAKGDLPPRIDKDLEHFTFAAQINVLRKVHAQCREKGESPERLTTLVRAYAHLGTLTEPLWSTANKAFKARALLYAERLVQRTKQAPAGLWTRAYARALAGRAAAARADLARAQEAAEKQKQKPPEWVALIDAYCQSDRQPLLASAAKGAHKNLARYLLMLSHEGTFDQSLLIQDVRRLVETTPDCLRAIEMLLTVRTLGLYRNVSQSSLAFYVTRWPGMLKRIEGLPDRLQKKLRDATPTEDDPEEPDLSGPAEFARELREAGIKDRQEPSLAMAAQLLDEWSLVRASHLVYVEVTMLGVPPDDTVAQLRPLFEHHPWGAYFDSQVSDRVTRRTALSQLTKAVNLAQVDWSASSLLFAMAQAPETKAAPGDIFGRLDKTLYRDLMLYISDDNNLSMKMRHTLRLREVAPDMRGTVAASLQNAKNDDATQHAAEWETKFQDDPYILGALANAYRNSRKFDEAIRCFNRQIELAPEPTAFRELAKIYYEQKKYPEWRKTLERALEEPELGLEQATIRVEIAEHYMRRGQFTEAQPFADEAAESFAAWALTSAARCYAGLEEWDKSEEYTKAKVGRYDGAEVHWFAWCVQTGHGDRRAAEAAARRYVNGLQKPLQPQQGEVSGVFYDLVGDNEKAMNTLADAFEGRRIGWYALEAALLADQLGKTELCRRLLGEVMYLQNSASDPTAEVYAKFAKLLVADYDSQKRGSLNTPEMKQLVDGAHDHGQVWLSYLLGRYLQNHEQPKASQEWLQRAATSPLGLNFGVPLARQRLHELKVEIEPTRYVKDD